MRAITVTGHADVDKLLAELPDRLLAAPLRKGLRAGAKIAADAVKHEAQASLSDSDSPAPHVSDEIVVRAMKRSRAKRRRVGMVVMAGRRATLGIKPDAKGFYPAHVEFGYQREDGTHVPANPFMKRGLESVRQRVIDAVAQGVREYVEKKTGLVGAEATQEVPDGEVLSG